MPRQFWACEWCLEQEQHDPDAHGLDGYGLGLGAGLYETREEADACEAKHEEERRQEQERARERRAEAVRDGKRQAAADRALLASTEAPTTTPIGDAVLPTDWLTMPIEELEVAITRNRAEVEARNARAEQEDRG